MNNYVACPKESGYRGVHLIYRYNASKTDYRGHLVELQLRSRVQHAWATAVEIVDNFTDQALKASIGDEDWLQFFKMAAAELAKLEKRPIGEHVDGVDTRAELIRLETKLNAFERLNMIRFATKFSEQKRVSKSDYFLIDVDYREREIFTNRYAPGQLAQATRDYSRRERQILDDRDHDVVLVSGESVAGIQAGYPNYFADAKNFIGYVFKATSGD